MPKDTSLSSVLIIGSGPIVIGQACEFDYSGSQSLRSLREDGIETILINSNPATIMTDPSMADHIYLKPLTTQETQLAHTQFYNSVDESFETLNYSTTKNVREVKTSNANKKKKKPEIFTNVFFDFETNTNEGKHKPYLCCCYFKMNGKEYREKFFGYDCGKKLLDFIPDKSVIVRSVMCY